MEYPGLTYIGSGKISGLYGLDETIHDQKSIGLQHLYIDDYQHDFIYSATTAVTLEDKCYYGDRIKPKVGHPIKQASQKSYCEDGFIFMNEFQYEHFNKTDSAYCACDNQLIFNCEIVNTSRFEKTFQVSALVITTNNEFELSKIENVLTVKGMGKVFKVHTAQDNLVTRVSKDAPSGFMYHGIQDILFDKNQFEEGTFKAKEPIAISLTKSINLQSGEGFSYQWKITAGEMPLPVESELLKAKGYWSNWLKESKIPYSDAVVTNLIALKAINMNGFLPADLTGHYFANNHVSLYVRDALLGARAFLYSGHFKECQWVVRTVSNLVRKENYELYQRYNAKLAADEGANNDVFSQIDVIGYLLRVVADYEKLTGELLIDSDACIKEVSVLDAVNCKMGLYGPEGGVNEGVYGPGYITSTNIFIASGLSGLIEILKNKNLDYSEIEEKQIALIKAINDTFLDEKYYAYGYVDYHDELVRRYDTPQLFGASLGYPIDMNYKANFNTLTNIATYFDKGYGYSEQEYHDGPWLFNTAFAAQNAYLFGDMPLYQKIIDWIENHKNSYGLLPEAIDARDESRCFINPLMWANAEYICAKYVHVIRELRNGEVL